MKHVTRVNLVRPGVMRRLEKAQTRIGEATLTETAYLLIEDSLNRMGLGVTDAWPNPAGPAGDTREGASVAKAS